MQPCRIAALVAAATILPTAHSDVILPALLSDGVVLQRETGARLWGWGRKGEEVRITPSWGGPGATATVGEDGRWSVFLRTPAAGGPHTITIAGDTQVTLRDVLIGEVWICSGQSNMEWPLAAIGPGREGVPSAEAEIAAASYPAIRMLTIANEMSTMPREDARATPWRECRPEHARDFSAVGYFFGRHLHKDLGVPIGLISADWGGTPAEAWCSAEALAPFKEFEPALGFLKVAADPNRRGTFIEAQIDDWWESIDEHGPGRGWASAEFDITGWKAMSLPATLSGDGLSSFDGFVYFRRTIEVPADFAGKPAILELGPIDDRDDVWIDGTHLAGTREDGRWSVARRYPIPAERVKAGPMTIAIRMLDTAGPGGINGAAEQMALRSVDAGVTPVSLAGEWRFSAGPRLNEAPSMPQALSMNPHVPSILYNAMIAPLTPMTARGVIWYQGESNVGRAAQYRSLFPALIQDWRRQFGRDLAFHFVQIAPFGYGGDTGQAAALREAQMAALKLAGTSMACAMDLGNPRDIHPDNKQEVGRRLALGALARTYGRAGFEHSGPLYTAHKVVRDEIHVRFSHADRLTSRGGDPSHFLIAGEDRQFYKARARVEGDTIIVSSPRVPKPAAVRYAWEADAQPNVFNGAGLPASSFRTDDWDGSLLPPMDDGLTEHLTNDPAFKPIFNGRDLAGWTNVNCAPSTFTVSDGMIRCTGVPTGVIRTDRMYENFILEMEWRHLSPQGNAGLFIWSDALTARGQPFTRSVEVQVMVGSEGDWYTSDGDIFPIHGAVMTPENGRGGGNRAFPTEKRMKPSPQWNHYRVECLNGEVSLAVNGKVVTRGKACSPRKGFICLEAEGTPIDFRNLRIKELPPASPPLPAEHIARAEEGFRPLYTGVDFAGWDFKPAHEGHFRADDWTISFDGQGEDLWTTESFEDFILIADWRWVQPARDADFPVLLPDGSEAKNADGSVKVERVADAGDSGIYLRGSSKSQVNIWCWPVGSGEVYGYRTDAAMPPEVRSAATPRIKADAPLGQWNRFIITMKGDRLTVELNGKMVIENAQLPRVAASGPIALQMHGTPIQFANLLIKELE